MKLEQNKIVITTGDDVSGVVWTQEKLDELQRVVDKIKQEEQENMRYYFELSDVKIADSQWSQIENAAYYLEGNIYMILCKVKNEQFDNFIYLNGGWVYYEKCPVCSMRLYGDGSNHKEFWDNHIEDYEDSCFYYDIEEMDRRIKNAHENPIAVPEHIKTPEEFCNWIMNYDKENNDK